jgi:hypothetical protein
MATIRKKRPRDSIALAKLIGDIATGQTVDAADDGKNAAAVARGKKGGAIGGKVRAEKLSALQRKKIAKKAIKARWNKP